MSDETYLVTGAMGCLGTWVVKLLLDEGCDVVAFDASDDDHRHRLVIEPEAAARVRYVTGDLTDLDQVKTVVQGASHIIHLAALQVPFCRANRPLGAAVNVVGTVNVMEAAVDSSIQHLTYASSVAVFGNASEYEEVVLDPSEFRAPTTLYGVWKCANESTARIFQIDYGLPSVGLIPHTVYGPGRDQGLTSQPTTAMLSAVRKTPYHIEYGGFLALQFAPDVARDFVRASRLVTSNAELHGIGGTVASIPEVVSLIRSITGFEEITHGSDELPFPQAVSSASWEERVGGVSYTPLEESIGQTVEWFERARSAGLPLPT